MYMPEKNVKSQIHLFSNVKKKNFPYFLNVVPHDNELLRKELLGVFQ